MHDPERTALGEADLRRFSRHLVLPQVGERGQVRLRRASVAIVGAGGLGSPVALYLAAAGVGRIALIDFDSVSLANLQRQVLFATADVGRPKVDAAAERLAALDPDVVVDRRNERVHAGNARDLLAPYDVIVDGSDNFAARYVVNDACVTLAKPFVHGSVFRFEGRVATFAGGGRPCYRCLHPVPPGTGEVPNCAEGGVLGVVPGVIGSLQAAEAIKLLLGIGDPLHGRLVVFDALSAEFREIRFARDVECAACADRPRAVPAGGPPGSLSSTGPATDAEGDIDVRALRARLDRGEDLVLIDVRTAPEWESGRIPTATWMPMHELASRIGELDPDRETVVYCHVGGRSAAVCRFLAQRGFRRVRNLLGGIDAWSRDVDRSIPRY